MRVMFLLALLLSIPLSQGFAADTTTIVVLGDSLTAGYGVAPEESFPSQMEQKLLAGGYKVKVINNGVSGDTSAGGLARIDFVIDEKPDIAVIELGANDLLRGSPTAELKANLTAILDRLSQAHVKIIVAGIRAPLTYGIQYSQDFNGIFCELAKKYDAECYPIFLKGAYGIPELMQPDGMHPNKEGVDKIVTNFYPLIAKLLHK